MDLPWTLNPPSMPAVCGVSPMCPNTGMPAVTIARTVSAISCPPSSFTESAPPSLYRMPAFVMACSFEMLYDMNGMSPTTCARFTARMTAFVCESISSIVTGTVPL